MITKEEHIQAVREIVFYRCRAEMLQDAINSLTADGSSNVWHHLAKADLEAECKAFCESLESNK